MGNEYRGACVVTSIYDTDAADVLAMIAEAGAPITFLADQFRGGVIASDVTGVAVEIPGDPDTLTALGLVERNPVTLLVPAKGLGITPAPGVAFVWGTPYTVKLATPLTPDRVPILWTIVGAA